MGEASPLISVVLSFRNEEDVLPELVRRLQATLRPLPLRHELVFVNDVSTDGSLSILRDLRRQGSRIRIVNTSRRCGVTECTMAGLRYARGDAVVYMDADLQDPPELLPELIAKWQQGADVVYTVRRGRHGESRAKMLLTRLAYRVINAVSEIELPVDAGDFRLLSRRALDEVLKLGETDPYLRGLVTWVGFTQVPVHYHREPRAAGVTHFPLLRSRGPIATFVRGFTSFSILPLVFFLLLGIVLSVVAAAGLAAVAVIRWRGGAVPDGTLGYVALMLATGIQLLGTGTVGLYLGRVFKEVRRRPNCTVSDTVGFDDDAS